MTNFAITGVGGFVAPRHLAAIKAVEGNLIAALDPHDSVGILDQFGFAVHYFQEFERFDRYLEKASYTAQAIAYLSICVPNYLHESHCRLALRIGADAICEKPLALNPDNLMLLRDYENNTGHTVWTILQMRLHPAIAELKRALINSVYHKVDIDYHTPRGLWYHYSWKGQPEKSGGLIMNIGVHLFDLMLYLFGTHEQTKLLYSTPERAAGITLVEHASINWKLSIDPVNGPKPRRRFYVDGQNYDFSDTTQELHIQSYQNILAGNGFRINDAEPAILLVDSFKRP